MNNMLAPPPQVNGFVGRGKELRILHDRTVRRSGNVIEITGVGGIGKTALVAQFLQMNSRLVEPLWVSPWTLKDPDEVFQQLLKELGQGSRKRSTVVVIDGAENIQQNIELYIHRILNYKRVNSIIITSRQANLSVRGIDTIHLDGLSTDDAVNFLSSAAFRPISYGDIQALVDRVGGHPLALIMVAQLLKDHTFEQVLAKLDGNLHNLDLSIPTDEEQISKLVVPRIIIANEGLIEKLKRHPENIHQVSPRKFEELIADLLLGMGWDIELTPQSKDGGKDIIAILKTEIGELLCLVEAKHYSPDRPVQVGLVRQLYGTFVDHGANSAMLVTSSRFTKGAREFQSKHQYQISLKEYADIVTWIQKYKGK